MLNSYYDRWTCPKCKYEQTVTRQRRSSGKIVTTYCYHCHKNSQSKAGLHPDDRGRPERGLPPEAVDLAKRLMDAEEAIWKVLAICHDDVDPWGSNVSNELRALWTRLDLVRRSLGAAEKEEK